MPEDVSPGSISEIASILAKGFLRYRKSCRFRVLHQVQNELDSAVEPSRHVTVVNDQRTDEEQ